MYILRHFKTLISRGTCRPIKCRQCIVAHRTVFTPATRMHAPNLQTPSGYTLSTTTEITRLIDYECPLVCSQILRDFIEKAN
jgi:hypothetical protein